MSKEQDESGRLIDKATKIKKTDDKFVAYSATLGEYATFPTFETAEKWLKEIESEDYDDNVSEEFCQGKCWIAKITHRSGYTITDRRENYCSEECNECEKEHCDEEQWPYNSEADYVGDMVVKLVEDETTEANAKLTEELTEKTERANAYYAALEIAEAELKQARKLLADARAEIERKDKLIEQMLKALERLSMAARAVNNQRHDNPDPVPLFVALGEMLLAIRQADEVIATTKGKT